MTEKVRGSYPTAKNIVEKIIGYDIKNEHEKEITEVIRWLEFSNGSFFRINKNFAHQNYELYAEGYTEPLHVIPIKLLWAIEGGSESFVYVCEECLKELKNRPPNLTGFPHKGTDEEKTKWALANWRTISPAMPNSSYIGHSIVLRTKLDDGTTRREVYCTKPYTAHNLVEIIQSSPTSAKERE